MSSSGFRTLFKLHTFLLCPFYPVYVEKNVLCSKCNTEIAGMIDRKRGIGRVRERVREKMAW